MKRFKQKFLQLIKDESGQGATEYILLLVVVVGIAFIFRNKIKEVVSSKVDSLAGDISGFD